VTQVHFNAGTTDRNSDTYVSTESESIKIEFSDGKLSVSGAASGSASGGDSFGLSYGQYGVTRVGRFAADPEFVVEMCIQALLRSSYRLDDDALRRLLLAVSSSMSNREE